MEKKRRKKVKLLFTLFLLLTGIYSCLLDTNTKTSKSIHSVILNRKEGVIKISFELDSSLIQNFHNVPEWGTEKTCSYSDNHVIINITFYKEYNAVSDSFLVKLIKRECLILNKNESPQISKSKYKDIYGFQAFSNQNLPKFSSFFGYSDKYATIVNVNIIGKSQGDININAILESFRFEKVK